MTGTDLTVATHRGLTWNDAGVATVTVYSASASSVSVCILDPIDPTWVMSETPLQAHGPEWSGEVAGLEPGDLYAIRADGTHSSFSPTALLLDPYATAVTHYGHDWQSVARRPDEFDWQGVGRPTIAHDKIVIYEAHLKGLTATHPEIPPEIRGSYAALGHPATIDYLTTLGVTTLELLPIHAFANEPRLRALGLVNYWGYNTVGFFAPHPRYGSPSAQEAGPEAIITELKTAIRELHRAGIQVVLDVVYNHTAEGSTGPLLHLRGLDERTYYRLDERGRYIDTTGCGNTVNFGNVAPQQLVMDSLRHWVSEYHIDGFRFDLAATLGRGADAQYTPEHPLLTAITADPALADTLMIAEPWDVGMGGWQSGGFRAPWKEWNDHFRDTARTFWLSDTAVERRAGHVRGAVGALANSLAGTANVFEVERGPLASINFVTAHDGFTLADLVAYNAKRNRGNGEGNRDGTENNHSYNFGVDGPTDDPAIVADRLRAARNLVATLLFSAGTPMLTAGDETLRSQTGNNNAYCHDSPLTWVNWDIGEAERDFRDTVAHLIALRAANPALRPIRYDVADTTTPSASRMEWFNADGHHMDADDWNRTGVRTLQFFASSTPEFEEHNQTLTIVHGSGANIDLTLPSPSGVSSYRLAWDSSWPRPQHSDIEWLPGQTVTVTGMSVVLLVANK